MPCGTARHRRACTSVMTGDGGFTIVADGAPERAPTPARGRPAGQGGYGLYVIADLTAEHGVHHEPDRELVWACLIEPS